MRPYHRRAVNPLHSGLLAIFVAVVGFAACGDREPRAEPEGTPAPALDTLAVLPTPDEAALAAELADGEARFNQVCALCHVVDAPATLAPPMRHVAERLHASFSTEQEGMAHVMGYVSSPDRTRSIMHDSIFDRWGIMPAQPLPEEWLRPIARWVWSIDTPLQPEE